MCGSFSPSVPVPNRDFVVAGVVLVGIYAAEGLDEPGWGPADCGGKEEAAGRRTPEGTRRLGRSRGIGTRTPIGLEAVTLGYRRPLVVHGPGERYWSWSWSTAMVVVEVDPRVGACILEALYGLAGWSKADAWRGRSGVRGLPRSISIWIFR